MAKQKIAVLGGGLGALSTVYGLTTTPGWEDRYDITVYQLGWRLGGKGASGRNMDEGMGSRIEEHGLHIWFGFYNNAFKMMIDTYDEYRTKQLAPNSEYQSVDGNKPAFRPLNMVSVMENIDNEWIPWTNYFPTNDEELGSDNVHWTPWTLLVDLFEWLEQGLDEIFADPTGQAVRESTTVLGKLEGSLAGAVRSLEAGLLQKGGKASASLLHMAVRMLKKMSNDPREHSVQHYAAIEGLLKLFLEAIEGLLNTVMKGNTRLRRFFISVDLALAVFRGVIRDDVLYRGWDAIDKYDFREWLKRNGCRSTESAPVRAAYSLVFAYVGGDVKQPNFAAGVCARAFARILFTYKGSILWKMQSGMGDIVFSPMYMVLKNKGVKFKFFHKVTDLKLTKDKHQIGEIHLQVQGTIKQDKVKQVKGRRRKSKPDGENCDAGNAEKEYDPFVWVKGSPCWPNQPLYNQIDQGAEWKANGYDPESAWCPPPAIPDGDIVLRNGKEFDSVVLGISLAALKSVAKEVIAHDQRWQDMVENVKTVQTQACQLWFNKTATDMGWQPWYPKTNNPVQKNVEDALVGAYVEPLDTWSDMPQVIPAEEWPAGNDVQSIAYFCGAMRDNESIPNLPPPNDCDFGKEETARVKANTKRMLLNNVKPLWPKATQEGRPTALDWDVLIDSSGAEGEERFDSQYFRANIAPTERYVLSVKGSTQYRLNPGESGYTNLYLAGDWTYNGLNVGCVEASVMSGLACSQAIREVPTTAIASVDFSTPKYVVGGGSVAFPGPYEFPNATMTAFSVLSSYKALQMLCDRWLNKPTGNAVDYRPLLPGFMVLVADFPMIEVNPGAANAFGSPEIDINLAFPVAKIKKVAGIPICERIAWFFPYLFVNNPWATASGREAYGFFKEYSKLTVPRSAADGGIFSVQTQCVDKFGEHAQTRPATVLEVTRKDARNLGQAAGEWTSLEQVMQALVEPLLSGDGPGITLPGLGLIEEAWDLLTKREAPFVFLKQFPAVDNRQAACYQSIVEAPLKITKLRSAGLLPGSYQVTASEFASHPIVSDMGMKGTTQNCLSAVTLTVDASLELGRQIWP